MVYFLFVEDKNVRICGISDKKKLLVLGKNQINQIKMKGLLI